MDQARSGGGLRELTHALLRRLQLLWHASNRASNVKSVGSGVMEYRIDYGPGYRLYFGRDGEQLIVLLAGGTKQRQQNGIETAQIYWQEYKSRKGG